MLYISNVSYYFFSVAVFGLYKISDIEFEMCM